MTAQQSPITEGITENWGNNFQYSTDWLHSLWSGTLLVSNSVASLLIVWVCLFRYVPSCHQITYLTFSDNGLNLHCLVIDLLKTFQNPIWGAVCSCCIISIEMHVKTHHLLKVVKPLSDTKARHVSLSKLSRIGTQQIIFHFFAHCTMNTNSLLMPVSRVTRYNTESLISDLQKCMHLTFTIQQWWMIHNALKAVGLRGCKTSRRMLFLTHAIALSFKMH